MKDKKVDLEEKQKETNFKNGKNLEKDIMDFRHKKMKRKIEENIRKKED